MRAKEDKKEITFQELLKLFAKHWLVLVLVTAICGIFGYAISSGNKTVTYTSQSVFFIKAESMTVNNNTVGGSTTTQTSVSLSNSIAVTKTLMPVFVMIMNSDDCLKTIADSLNTEYGGEIFDADYLRKIYSLQYNADTLTISIEVTTPQSKTLAARMAELMRLYGEETVKEACDINGSNASDDENMVTITTADITKPDVQRVRTNVTNVPLYTAIGAVIGLVLAIVGVVIIHAMDNKVGTEEEISEKLGIPVLATIPALSMRQARKSYNQSRDDAGNNNHTDQEAPADKEVKGK